MSTSFMVYSLALEAGRSSSKQRGIFFSFLMCIASPFEVKPPFGNVGRWKPAKISHPAAFEGITDDEGDRIDGVIRSLRRSNLLMALLHRTTTILLVLAYIKAAVMR